MHFYTQPSKKLGLASRYASIALPVSPKFCIVRGSEGFQSRLGIDTSNPVTISYDYDECSLGANQTIDDFNGLKGTADHSSERTRAGMLKVMGTIGLTPSPEDLAGSAGILGWILGSVASTTYIFTSALATRYVTHDKVAKVMTYNGVVVNKATFTASEGQPMKLNLDVIGLSETIANAGTFPSNASAPYNLSPPFMHFDSVLTILSSSRKVKNWSLTLDNQIDPKFYNSQTATALLRKDFIVTFSCDNPYTSAEVDLYNQAAAGAAASLVLTFGAKVLTFNFASFQVPRVAPSVQGRAEIPLKLNAGIRSTGQGSGLTPSIGATLALS